MPVKYVENNDKSKWYLTRANHSKAPVMCLFLGVRHIAVNKYAKHTLIGSWTFIIKSQITEIHKYYSQWFNRGYQSRILIISPHPWNHARIDYLVEASDPDIKTTGGAPKQITMHRITSQFTYTQKTLNRTGISQSKTQCLSWVQSITIVPPRVQIPTFVSSNTYHYRTFVSTNSFMSSIFLCLSYLLWHITTYIAYWPYREN